MTKEEIIKALEEKELMDIVEMIQDAEKGYMKELELVEQIGLLHDSTLNQEVIRLLESLGVEMIYVTYEDEEEEEEGDE